MLIIALLLLQSSNLRSPTLAGAPIILSPSRPATNAQTAASAAAAAALAAQLQAVASQQQQQQNAAALAFSQQASNTTTPTVASLPAQLLQQPALGQGDYGQLYLKYGFLFYLLIDVFIFRYYILNRRQFQTISYLNVICCLIKYYHFSAPFNTILPVQLTQCRLAMLLLFRFNSSTRQLHYLVLHHILVIIQQWIFQTLVSLYIV